jgi:dipeptide/tripeptide permease
MKNYAMNELGFSSNDAYHFSFMVACAALILSIAIYYVFRPTFRHVEGGKRVKGATTATIEDNLSPAETKQRIIALCLVFAVVIFFWMAFHQNGLTLTFFANEFTQTSAHGFDVMWFDVWNLAMIIVAVYATFSIFQSDSAKGKLLSGTLASAMLALLIYRAMGTSAADSVTVDAPIFQQFNPFYVVALTPVSMAVFGALARKGKEPSAPRKIAYGMLVAAIGFVVMALGSTGLNTPDDQKKSIAVNQAQLFAVESLNLEVEGKTAEDIEKAEKDFDKKVSDFTGKLTPGNKKIYDEVYAATTKAIAGTEWVGVNDASRKAIVEAVKEDIAKDGKAEVIDVKEELGIDTKPETRTSPYWLIVAYLVLTFAELLLSPMGISFVSKVAPPKYKGMMMGGWFVATAIGNFLVAVGGMLWAGLPLWSVWAVFVALCLLSALFMFVMMKRLESATK